MITECHIWRFLVGLLTSLLDRHNEM